jgi:hypothetical protein
VPKSCYKPAARAERGGACRALAVISTCAWLTSGPVVLGTASAQTSEPTAMPAAGVTHLGRRTDGQRPLLLPVDLDDDDDDGVADDDQIADVPREDLVELVLQAGDGPVKLVPLGELRVIRRGIAMPTPATLTQDELPVPIFLQARGPSMGGRPLALLVSRGGRTTRVDFHAVELSLLDANNRRLAPERDGLQVSRRVTNDRSLPRTTRYDARSPDPDNVRLQIVDAAGGGKVLTARIESLLPVRDTVRDAIELRLTRPRIGLPFRSPFVRLVSDEVDRHAPGVAGQVLQVGLRDRLRIVYRSDLGEVTQQLRVGRPGDEDGPRAARRARLRAVVMRAYPGGPPVIGVDDASALRIVRDEVAIANEIWLQCGMTFGPPSETAVTITDSPGATLIAVSDGDGLPAAGDGEIRLRVDGRELSPIRTRPEATPMQTALQLEIALEQAGFDAVVTVNPKTVFGAHSGADVLVRRPDGRFVELQPVSGKTLSSDSRQRITVGRVDLGDGLAEFDNMTATGGTLEERTLIKALGDGDPSTIDLFIVNRFTQGTRQGEAFIEGSAGPIVNTVVLDRNGLRQRQTAWTMAHEIGHVLLNHPLHPDNVGPDQPSLLMDADNNRGTVNGPKRLTEAECQRVRRESGVDASPPLLRRHDARPGVP